jgi:hypothetical protein
MAGMEADLAAFTSSSACTAFAGQRLLAAGPLADVALAVRAALAADGNRGILVFNDSNGRVIDLDLRGTEAEVLARLSPAAATNAAQKAAADPQTPRGRGRPKLGVVAREVTLLPRQWEWLSAQPGGASVALRRLVDEARRGSSGKQQVREAQEVAYRFMSAMAGNLPGFEEALRALFAPDRVRFDQQIASWPAAIRDYASKLASGAFTEETEVNA